jgi:hypothetical protein
MGKLTDRDFAPSVDLNTLIHIVNTGDTSQSAFGSSYKATLSDLVPIFGEVDAVIQTTGTTISFDKRKVYNTASTPGTSNVTTITTGAKLGTIQKIYHNNTIAPTFFNGVTPWTLIGDGVYMVNILNIIYAEWCGNGRIEYWITQQQ